MNKPKYHIGNNKRVSELSLYRTLTIFLKELRPKILNLQKDIKITYGYTILHSTTELIKLIKKTFNTPNYKFKLETINKLIDELGDIELEIKMLYEIGDLSLSQVAVLSMHLGNMFEQITKWKNYIDSKIKQDITKKEVSEI